MIFVTCVDESPTALEVIDHAVAQAKRWDAKLHVLHVNQPPASLYALDTGFALASEELAEAGRQAVWSQATGALDESGVEWNRVDLQGYPASVICAYAKEHEADMIIIGTRGRGEFASLVLGSTSHGVIHGAPCDVLVVRPSDEEA